MASLIEDLINTLDLENEEYKELLKLSNEKTSIIIKGDVAALNDMIVKEQAHTDRISALEGRRIQVIKDIATVLNRDVDTLTVKEIIMLLKGQDSVQKQLSQIHDRLKITLNDMVVINEINSQLIEESLELVNFNINYINSINQMPETANYNRNAYNSSVSIPNSRFDAKN